MIRSLLKKEGNGEKTAVMGSGENVSYSQLANKAAAIQQAITCCEKENIALFLPNGSDFISALYAVITLGLVAFPLNPLMTAHEAAPLLKQASVNTVVTSKMFSVLFDAIPDVSAIYIEEIENDDSFYSLREIDCDSTAPMLLLATSGTTGNSKIVQLSEQNVEASMLGYLEKMQFNTADAEAIRYILVTPFSSAYGLMILFACLTKAFPIIYLEDPFTLNHFFRTAAAYRATHYEGSSMILQFMEKMAGRTVLHDIHLLKNYGFGGSKVSANTIEAVVNAYEGVVLRQGYGMTEASPLITKYDWPGLEKADSVGSPIRGVKIVLETARGIRTQEAFVKGEILVKGPNIMLGYYKNKTETEKVIKNGYLCTGDIGYLDQDGYLFICGRKKNIIIVRGQNVHPEEVESCIQSSRFAMDCVVYGQEDESGNEFICADVVPANKEVTAQDILTYCAGRLAVYKRPRMINICEAVGKNTAGKTDRLTVHPGKGEI